MEKYIEKECKHHGLTTYVYEKRGSYRCKKCRAEGVVKRRKKIKEELIQYKGGECVLCGYMDFNGALDFHHVEPENKSFGLAIYSKSLKVMKEEADKCVLLCANCHREIEGGHRELI